MIKSRRIRLAVYVEHTTEKGNIQKVLGGTLAGGKNVIIKWFLEEQKAVLSNGFIWPRREMIGGIL
jgi:hypothetical protein